MGLNGLELSSKTVDIRPVSDKPGAKSGAVGAVSGAIHAIADAIKGLSDIERQRLLELMKEARP